MTQKLNTHFDCNNSSSFIFFGHPALYKYYVSENMRLKFRNKLYSFLLVRVFKLK